jgi:acyl-CoA dehydrogenase
VQLFKKQISVFKEMLTFAPPGEAQQNDVDFLLALGEIFALVVYGQLILENVPIYNVNPDLVDQIFDCLVRDFSRQSLNLYSKPTSTQAQMNYALCMLQKPAQDEARYKRVWEVQVLSLSDAYTMTP